MPALDRDHRLVRRALEKEGWTITHDPLTLTIGKRNVLVDFGAERLLAAERGAEKIAVEVKTFAGPSPIADLQQAYGQFGVYEEVLATSEPERMLYLAIPEEALEGIFTEEIGQIMLKNRFRRVCVYGIDEEKIVQWIP
jgi:hypothetical protein